MPDAHLSREELTAWREEGFGDREHVVAHIAACGPCRHLAAEIERARPLDVRDARGSFRAADFTAAGYRARPAARRAWGRAMMPFAAAAALVLVAGIAFYNLKDEPTIERGGSTGIALVAPLASGVDRSTFTFEWQAAATAGPFRLRVFDASRPDETPIDRQVDGAVYAPSPEERQRLRAGVTYRWFVEYEKEGGGRETSPAGRFSIR